MENALCIPEITLEKQRRTGSEWNGPRIYVKVDSSVSKGPACSAWDPGSFTASGRCPGGGNDDPLECSCLENPMDRGARRAPVHGVTRVGHDLRTKPAAEADEGRPLCVSVSVCVWDVIPVGKNGGQVVLSPLDTARSPVFSYGYAWTLGK